VNFIDVYFRTGLYKAERPIALGNEAAGTVEAVGSDVTEVAVGDRVAYAMARGSYAEYAAAPAAVLVKLPDAVDFRTGAAAMLQGMTAHYLTHSTYPLKRGGRGWRPGGADGQAGGGAGIRHRFHRRQGGHRARARRRRHHSLYRTGF
jgi:NADPH2:quinone reductase